MSKSVGGKGRPGGPIYPHPFHTKLFTIIFAKISTFPSQPRSASSGCPFLGSSDLVKTITLFTSSSRGSGRSGVCIYRIGGVKIARSLNVPATDRATERIARSHDRNGNRAILTPGWVSGLGHSTPFFANISHFLHF